MGNSSQNTKSNSTTNSNFNTTTTPTNPSWVTDGLSQLGSTVNNLNNLDPYSLVSGPNADQTQASATLNGPAGVGVTSNGDLGGAADVLRSTVNQTAPTISNGGGAQNIAALISQYENPNLSQVVNPSLAAFDYNAGQTQAQQALTQAGTDAAFGGSGAALASAATNSQLALQRGQLASGLYSDAYNSALTGATSQAQLQEQAAQRALQASEAQAQAQQQQQQISQAGATDLGNIGLAYDQNARANASAYQGIGDDLRSITQQQLTAPLSTASTLAGIYSSMPLSLLHGQNSDGTQNSTTNSDSTTTTTPSALQDITGLAGAAGSIMTGLGGLGVGMGSTASGLSGLGSVGGLANFGGTNSFIPTTSVNFLGGLGSLNSGFSAGQ